MSAPSSPWICEAPVPKKTGPGRAGAAAQQIGARDAADNIRAAAAVQRIIAARVRAHDDGVMPPDLWTRSAPRPAHTGAPATITT